MYHIYIYIYLYTLLACAVVLGKVLSNPSVKHFGVVVARLSALVIVIVAFEINGFLRSHFFHNTLHIYILYMYIYFSMNNVNNYSSFHRKAFHCIPLLNFCSAYVHMYVHIMHTYLFCLIFLNTILALSITIFCYGTEPYVCLVFLFDLAS